MNKLPPVWMREKYETVAVGYRGADGSSVLHMPEVNQAMKGVGDDLLSQESLDNISAAIAQGVDRLQSEGVDLEGYTIPEVVADMEAARKALGYEQINLYSVSYGTRVAQIYSYLAPDSLHRSVQNAVNPPGRMVWEPDMVDTQLEYLSDLCAKDPVCSTRTDDLAEAFRNVMHNMPERWLFLPIDQGKVKVISFIGFDAVGIGTISETIIAAEQGDPSGLAMASLAYNFLIGGDILGDKLAKGASADMDLARDYLAELDPPDSIMGSPAALTVWGPAADVWPTTLIPAELRQTQYTDVETLLVSGSIDFRSPPQYATNELLPYLNNGQQVIMSEHGHNDVFIQGDALEHLILSFYETGVGDDSLITYHPMDFTPQMNFPQIAKIAMGILALLVLLLAVLLRLVIRRINRRRLLRSEP